MAFCSNCGKKILDKDKFCSGCGTPINNSNFLNNPKIIKLKCQECNGTMDVDEDREIIMCPYCGSKNFIMENETIKIEKIRNKTIKDIEINKVQANKEIELAKEINKIQADKEIELQKEEYKFKRKSEKADDFWTIVLMIFVILFLIFCYRFIL